MLPIFDSAVEVVFDMKNSRGRNVVSIWMVHIEFAVFSLLWSITFFKDMFRNIIQQLT